jgi:O-antigen/teichoic acid export membrane protein
MVGAERLMSCMIGRPNGSVAGASESGAEDGERLRMKGSSGSAPEPAPRPRLSQVSPGFGGAAQKIPSRQRAAIILLAGNLAMVLANVVRNLALVPFYIKEIGAAPFGAWLACSGAVAFIQLADLGLNNLLTQQTAYLHGKHDYAGLRSAIGTILKVTAVLSVAAGGVVWLAAPLVARACSAEPNLAIELVLAIRIAAVDAAAMLLALGIGAVLIGVQRPGYYMIAVIVGQIIGIGVTIAGLDRGIGLKSIPIGMLCGTAVVIVSNAVTAWRALTEVFASQPRQDDSTVASLKGLTKSSALLFLSRIAYLVSTRSYGIVAAVVVSTPAVVVIELTRKASLVVSDVVSRIPTTLLSGLAHLSGAGEDDRFRSISGELLRTTFLLAALGCGGVLLLNREFVHLWAGQRFFGGSYLSAALCIHVIVQMLNAVFYNVLLARGNIANITLAGGCEAVVQMAAAVVLGKLFGPNGIAAALMLGAGSAFVLQMAYAARVLEWKWGNGALVASAAGTLGLGCLPVAIGWAVHRAWEPRGWAGLVLFGVQYVAVGFCSLLALDRSFRRVARLCVAKVVSRVR